MCVYAAATPQQGGLVFGGGGSSDGCRANWTLKAEYLYMDLALSAAAAPPRAALCIGSQALMVSVPITFASMAGLIGLAI